MVLVGFDVNVAGAGVDGFEEEIVDEVDDGCFVGDAEEVFGEGVFGEVGVESCGVGGGLVGLGIIEVLVVALADGLVDLVGGGDDPGAVLAEGGEEGVVGFEVEGVGEGDGGLVVFDFDGEDALGFEEFEGEFLDELGGEVFFFELFEVGEVPLLGEGGGELLGVDEVLFEEDMSDGLFGNLWVILDFQGAV